MDEERRPLHITRLVEHEHASIAVVVDFEDLDAHIAPAFLAVPIAQHHGLPRREVAKACPPLAGFHGNLQARLLRRM